MGNVDLHCQAKPDYQPTSNVDVALNKQQTAHLPGDVIRLIMPKVSAASLGTARLVCRAWLKVADQEHKKILLTFLRIIGDKLKLSSNAIQRFRLNQLIIKVASIAPEILSSTLTKQQIGQELVDILCEVYRSDVEGIVIDPNYIPNEFVNILDLATRTYKGNISFRDEGFSFYLPNYPDPKLAGLHFIPNEVNIHEDSSKRAHTIQNLIELKPDICRFTASHFPRLVDIRVLEGKKYGDFIQIGTPLTSLPKIYKPLHFILYLQPAAGAPKDQTLAQKVQEVLTHQEFRVNKIDEQYNDEQYNLFMLADSPTMYKTFIK